MFKQLFNQQREEYYTSVLFPPKTEQCQIGFIPNEERTVKATIPVSFQNIRFGGDRGAIVQEMEKPRFEITKNKFAFIYKILFYRQVINQRNAIMQFHLIEDQLFYGCHVFPDLEQQHFTPIKSMVLKKYADINGNSHMKYDTIIDESKNTVTIDEDVLLRIGYLTGDESMKYKVILTLNSAPSKSDTLSAHYPDIYKMI